MKDMTLGEVDKILTQNGQKLAMSWGSGQYHAYVFRNGTLEHYERGDDLASAVRRAVGEKTTS